MNEPCSSPPEEQKAQRAERECKYCECCGDCVVCEPYCYCETGECQYCKQPPSENYLRQIGSEAGGKR